jgi:phosphate transport system permease protein
MAAAAKRIGRLKRIDRAAVFVITLGGIAVVVCVLGILVFIGAESLPLFRAARVSPGPPVRFETGRLSAAPGLRAVGVDEYRRYLFTVEPDARVVFRNLSNGSLAFEFPIPGLAPGTPVVSSSRSLLGNYLAAGTSDGRVALMQVTGTPRYVNQAMAGLDVQVRDRSLVRIDPGGRPVREVSYLEEEGRKYVAAIVGDRDVALWRTDDAGAEHLASVAVAPDQRVTHVRVGRSGVTVAATSRGRLYHWVFDDATPRLTDVSPVSNDEITAIEFVIGGNSVVVGTAGGEVSSWFRASMPNGVDAMVRAHVFEPQGASVSGFAMSPRDRSFAASGADGSLVLRHQTSERTLARIERVGSARLMVVSPKADTLYALVDGALVPYALDNPHPEVSWQTLVGKVWYEGYARPEYVWQSTGATDDFESKLSLVPLVFGTIKGTFYAMLFAVPLAVFGALYTSQFVHPSIKAKIKPTVEIMAALPSVVIGFLAGLYLAGLVERHLVAVFVVMGLMPVFGTAGVFLWRTLPEPLARRLKPGTELVVIIPLLLLAVLAGAYLGPIVEALVFGGDAKSWLHTVLGLTYDQRNCLVVGLAMGFAIIPIIFTISEDAFTSVPSSLTAHW